MRMKKMQMKTWATLSIQSYKASETDHIMPLTNHVIARVGVTPREQGKDMARHEFYSRPI